LGAKVIAKAAPPAHSARSVVIMDGIVFRRPTYTGNKIKP